MKSRIPHAYDNVPTTNADDDLRELDQSEKEYNRMISKHMSYHRTLMDDLIRLSSEPGSGSGSSPRELLQQQMNQANQANIVRGMGTTMANLNTSNQQLMQSASNFVHDTETKATNMSRLNDFIQQNVSKLNQDIDSYQALEAEANEGYRNMSVRAATSGTTAQPQPHPPTSGTTAQPQPHPPTSGTITSMDAALEVSNIMKESHKYGLVIFGIIATYALYKTIKHM
jgi:hypothetical protein